MQNKNSMIEGLIVLEYLELGIMPFYPGNPTIGTSDRKARRKFRKIWKKVSDKYGIRDRLSSPHNKADSLTLYKRKMLVHGWIKKRVYVKYLSKLKQTRVKK